MPEKLKAAGFAPDSPKSFSRCLHQDGLDAGDSESRKESSIDSDSRDQVQSFLLPSPRGKTQGLTEMTIIGRSARTGRFTTVEQAIRRPNTHVVENVDNDKGGNDKKK